MSLVWRKIQRSNKKAAKFKFVASFQELVIQCSEKWQPTKVAIAWAHRRRRYVTKAYRWEPSLTDPYRGLIVWPEGSENLEILTTLYRDLRNETFEDKEWTFVVEEARSKGKYKPIAAVNLNLRLFISEIPGTQTEVKLKLRPLTDHVKSCVMQLVLTSTVVKEGDALDEDIQSVASLMSMQQGAGSSRGSSPFTSNTDDIANIKDLETEFGSAHSKIASSESTGSETAAKISEIAKTAVDWVKERSPDKDIFPPKLPVAAKPRDEVYSAAEKKKPPNVSLEDFEEEAGGDDVTGGKHGADKEMIPNGGLEAFQTGRLSSDDSGFLEKEPPSSTPTVVGRGVGIHLLPVPSSPLLVDAEFKLDSSDITPKPTKSTPNLISYDLLSWCQEITKDYRYVKITDFAKSWRDGMAFCAIIHHFRPELMDFDSLNPRDIRGNCRMAFDTAASLGIPKLLDPNDMLIMKVPDKIAVISYVHALRDHFLLGKGSGANSTATTRQSSAVSGTSTATEGPDDPNNRLSLFSLDEMDEKVFAEFSRFREERDQANAVYESSFGDTTQESQTDPVSEVKLRQNKSSSKSPTPEKVGKKKKKKDKSSKSPRKSPRKSTESDRSSSGSANRGSRVENTENTPSAERTTPLMSRKELKDPFGSVSEEETEEKMKPGPPEGLENEDSCDGQAVSVVERQREDIIAQELHENTRRGSGDSVSALNRLSRGSSSNSREEDLRARARHLLAEFTKDHEEKGREPTPEEEDERKRELRERARMLISEAKQQSDTGTIRISETLQDTALSTRPHTLITPRGVRSEPNTRETTPETASVSLRRLVVANGSVLGALGPTPPLQRNGSIRKIERVGASVNFYQFRNKQNAGTQHVQRGPGATRFQRIPYPDSPVVPALGTRKGVTDSEATPRSEPIKICIGERTPSQAGSQDSETTFDRVKRFGSMRKQELTETIGVLSRNVAQSVRSASVPKQLESLSTPLRRPTVPQSVSVVERADECNYEPVKTKAWEQELASHQDIVAQLEEVGLKQEELDKKATQVEKEWRKVMQEAQGSEAEQELMNEFLRLLNERNLLTRQELHLSLLEKIHDYEHRFQLVQQELGNLINIEEGEKTEAHKQRIDRLMEELINIVNKKDELVQQLMANEQEAEEDSALGQDVLQAGKLPVQDEKCVIQ